MALVPKEIDDRIAALEERVALIEEALAPKDNRIEEKDEVHTAMMKKAALDKNQEWVIPKE